MFDKKTLFIIGAGASSEFNLPVGSELRHLIADFLVQTPDGGRGSSIVAVNEAPLATAIQALPHRRPGGGVPDEYKTAAFTIRDNMYHEDSIDQFLHLMRDDQVITDLGKMSIAWIICQSEGKSKMAVPQRPAFQHYEETWLNIFGKTLFDGVSRNKITNG